MLGPAYDLWRLDCPDDDCELTEEEIARKICENANRTKTIIVVSV